MENLTHFKKVCADFSLGEVGSVIELDEGVLNKNFLLTTSKGKYFIKSVREKRKAEIPYIYGVETFMARNGIPAIPMLRNTSGSLWTQCESDTYTVYPFLESDRTHIYSDADYRSMGEMLARIHKAGSTAIPPLLASKEFTEKNLDAALTKLQHYRNTILAKTDQDDTDALFLSFIDLKLSLITTLEDIQLPNDTLTHGDYHERNLLINSAREIVGICDWEKAQMAPRSHEFVRAFQYICINREEGLEKSLRKGDRFTEGYQSIYPISNEEIEAGRALRFRKLATSFWIEEQYYDRKDTRSNIFIENEMYLLTNWYHVIR